MTTLTYIKGSIAGTMAFLWVAALLTAFTQMEVFGICFISLLAYTVASFWYLSGKE